MKFTQLAKSIEGGLDPVYLIEGAEAYFRDHAVNLIREACALNQPALNDVRIEGETLKGEKLSSFVSGLATLPFFDERRLVRVYEFYPTEREFEQLSGYLEKPCPTTVLLIVNTGSKKGADLKKKKGVCYVDCGRESEENLSRWLFGLARRQGLQIDADASSLMVHYCNLDAARMRLEIEKLTLMLGHGGRITRQVVEENVAKDVEYKVYELTQAASRGNYSAFSEILHDLMEKGFDESAALASLTAHYRTLLEISQMTGSDAEIGTVLKMAPYAVQKNREAARRLGREKVRELYLYLYGLSAEMRSGQKNKAGALSAAVAKIFFG